MSKKITPIQLQQLMDIAGITAQDAILLTQIDMLLDQRIEALSKEHARFASNREATATNSAYISFTICEQLKDHLLDLIKEYIQYV